VIAGLSGSLFSHDALERMRRQGAPLGPGVVSAAGLSRRLSGVRAAVRSQAGPASPPRAIFDLVADPLVRGLGFSVVPAGADHGLVHAVLQVEGRPLAVLLVSGWDEPAGGAWRPAVHRGLAHRARWAILVNGWAVRLMDIQRPYARRHAEFDLTVALENDETLAVMAAVLGAAALTGRAGTMAVEEIVAFCERHRGDVRTSLRNGVHEALLCLVGAFRRVARRRHDSQLLDEALIVIYRILFLLFAEARGLVPAWHPIYRDAYTIGSLRRRLRDAADPGGVWEALQAVGQRHSHKICVSSTSTC
jgi:hypothetical protein